MKDIFIRPEFIKQAAEQSKGRHLAIEVLIFLLVFAVSTIAQVIILIPIFIIALVGSEDFRALIRSIFDDRLFYDDEIAENVQKLIDNINPYLMLAMLFATLVTIGAVILYCRAIEKRKLNTLGLVKKHAFREYFIGYLVGIVLISAVVLLGNLAGVIKINGLSADFAIYTMLLYFLGFLIQGMSEEMLCRGYLMVSVSRRYSLPAAIIANSIAFSALHIFNSGITIVSCLNLALFGVFASVYMIVRGSIWGTGALHSAWNFALGNIFGIEVSGMPTPGAVFSVTVENSRLTGGSFGLEGGYGTTIILIIAIIVVSVMSIRKSGEAISEAAEKPPA